jgi:GNAT superfamily N-acetyltransferase
VLGSEADLLIVAVDRSNKVVGWLQAHASVVIESGFRAEIVGMIVSETARRGGVGRLLVAKAETWARKISAPAMVVRSNIKRRASHKFYSALGYRPIKTQVVYRKELSHLAG